jgi:hypothetical protein
MVARRYNQTSWPALLAGTAIAVWGWRVEFAAVAGLVSAQRLLAGRLGETAAAVVVLVGVVGALAVGPVRRAAWRMVRGAWVRRAWRRAVTDVGLALDALRAPRVLRVRRIPAGEVLRVRVCRGQSVATLEARTGELGACLRVREVRVEPERGDAALVEVTLIRRDPFDDPTPLAWPDAAVAERSLWDPIPVGVDELAEPVQIRLVERNVLVGGEPGAGKSVALSVIVAAAALDPSARLWLLDGKLVELAPWAPVAERLVGPDVGAAIALLRELQGEMDARYRELLARGLRKIRRDDELALHLVVVDELAFYLTHPDAKQRKEFTERLRDVVARGRAAGVIVVCATQKPGRDVVPTSLRDLFGFRLALRCNTRDASDTILGHGWASVGADASTIPGAQRGIGFLLAEGERPIRVMTYHLDDDELVAIAERAAARRADAWLRAQAQATACEAVQ